MIGLIISFGAKYDVVTGYLDDAQAGVFFGAFIMSACVLAGRKDKD